MTPLLVAVLASGSGSNLGSIIGAFACGQLRGSVKLVISNNSRSGAMRRAREAGISALHLSSKTHPDPGDRDRCMCAALEASGVNLICLAGYMKKLGPETLSRYSNRIINIHPALLPRHGGKGMYGERVHRAVLDAGDTETGATVHLVDEEYDQGPILTQRKVPVCPGDTAASLGARVLKVEHQLYVETLAAIQAGQIPLESDPCPGTGLGQGEWGEQAP